MPRPRLLGARPMTVAERQARHRAKLGDSGHLLAKRPPRRPPPRPQRWTTAVTALLTLQDKYRAWLDNLPADLEGSSMAEKLQAIAELDLNELSAIDPPRGYGCD